MASTTRTFGSRCRVLMAASKSAAATDKSTATSAAGRKTSVRVTGILKVQTVSPALAKLIGSPETSRTGAIKKIWEYVKSHNLQNPSNKREIYCDDKLKTIFDGKDKVDFPAVAKLLTSHFRRLHKFS